MQITQIKRIYFKTPHVQSLKYLQVDKLSVYGMVTIFIWTVNKFSKNTRGLNSDIPAQSFDVDTCIA